jgi:hypothetical protein
MEQFDLVGVDGNAFSVMGYVINAMRKCRLSKEDRDAYTKEAMSSDYDHLLSVSLDMVDKCNEIYASKFSD